MRYLIQQQNFWKTTAVGFCFSVLLAPQAFGMKGARDSDTPDSQAALSATSLTTKTHKPAKEEERLRKVDFLSRAITIEEKRITAIEHDDAPWLSGETFKTEFVTLTKDKFTRIRHELDLLAHNPETPELNFLGLQDQIKDLAKTVNDTMEDHGPFYDFQTYTSAPSSRTSSSATMPVTPKSQDTPEELG